MEMTLSLAPRLLSWSRQLRREREPATALWSRGVYTTSPGLPPPGHAHGFREPSRGLDDLVTVAPGERRRGERAPCPHRPGSGREPVRYVVDGDPARGHEGDVRERAQERLKVRRPSGGTGEELYGRRAEPVGEHDLR